jgi:Cdc6-like AAA superfamily ATPase
MNNAKDIKKSSQIRGKTANNTESNLIIPDNDFGDDREIMKGLCGNKEIYSNIISWLRNFNYKERISTDSCIIITGKTCVGKTYSINKICDYLNYEIININNNNCFNSEQLNDVIFKSATSSLLQVLTGNIRNKVIVIDNFDCIYISDKTINTTLLKILTDGKIRNIPIICISNNEIIKKIGDIKKTRINEIIEMENPYFDFKTRTFYNKPYELTK